MPHSRRTPSPSGIFEYGKLRQIRATYPQPPRDMRWVFLHFGSLRAITRQTVESDAFPEDLRKHAPNPKETPLPTCRRQSASALNFAGHFHPPNKKSLDFKSRLFP